MFKHFWIVTAFLFFHASYAQERISTDSARVQAMEADTNKVRAWLKLSEGAVRENYESGRRYARLALDLAQKLNHQQGVVLAHEKLGHSANYLGDYSQAFQHYHSAYLHYRNSGMKNREAAMLIRMGESKRMLGQYEEALGYFQSSTRINRTLNDTNELGSCYISIGILYVVQGNEEMAEKYFLQAIESFRSIGNAERENLTMLNLGGLYREIGENNKSIELSLKARDYFLAHGPEVRTGIAYYNLGVAYYELDDLQKSKEQYRLGLDIFERLGDKLRINGINMRLSEIALKQGEYDLALRKAELALQGFEELEGLSGQVWAFDQISRVHRARGNYKSALEYRLQYEEMLDSMNTRETKEHIAELEEKYQSELKDQQLEQAEAEIELNALVLQKQQNQKYAVMGLAVFILIILILLYNQFRIKKRTNKTLYEKNDLIQKSLDEKEVLLKEIHHRVKNNLQFISSLLNLQARHVTDPQTLAVLTEGKNRVQSMALVHQLLYREENLKGVHMPSYVANLTDSLVHSYKIDRSKTEVRVEVENIYLDVDTALPVGLILNELITNAFKYAFGEEEHGKLTVRLSEKENVLVLYVTDNGNGLPEEFHLDRDEQFGYKLIKSLGRNLKAQVKTRNDPGATIEIIIENYKKT